jgi:hypothetical protein
VRRDVTLPVRHQRRAPLVSRRPAACDSRASGCSARLRKSPPDEHARARDDGESHRRRQQLHDARHGRRRGLPWVSPVWYAPASYREFFWVSRPGARRSRNIVVRPEVGIVIRLDRPDRHWKGRVHGSSRGEVSLAAEVERGMAVFSARPLRKEDASGRRTRSGRPPRLRLYRAHASEQFVVSPHDERLPFSLE